MPAKTVKAWVSALINHHQQLAELMAEITELLQQQVPDNLRLQRKLRQFSIGIKTHISTERHIHRQYRPISGEHFKHQAAKLDDSYVEILSLLNSIESAVVSARYNSELPEKVSKPTGLIIEYFDKIRAQVEFENRVYLEIENEANGRNTEV